MLTPVPATLPDSTLSPSDIMAKFSPQSLAGLGYGPYGLQGLGDDDGSDDGSSDDGGLDLSNLPTSSTLDLNTIATVAPGVTPITTVSGGGSGATGSTPTSYLQCLMTQSDPNACSPAQFSAPATSSSSGSLTNTQLASLASQLAAGVSQAVVLSQLPPGYSIKNGSIVAPGTSFLSGSSGTILLFLAIGVGLFVAMEKK